MQTIFNGPIRKVLIGILLASLLASLLVFTVMPSLQALAAPVKGALPAGLLGPGGALNLTTGFRGALDLRGWQVTLDAQRGPLFLPASSARNASRANKAMSSRSALAPSDNDWSALGTGMWYGNRGVSVIAVDGTNAVYAGGDFIGAGTCASPCYHIAKWDGSTWSGLGTGMNGAVTAIAVSGGSVYAGGWFTSAGTCTSGCNHIAKWDGSTWTALSTGVNDGVYSIAVSGTNAVYDGGTFTCAKTCKVPLESIAKYTQSSYSVFLPLIKH